MREVIVGKDGKAKGVLFIDKTTGKEERVKGKAVVLAASSGETVRILLNSASGKGDRKLQRPRWEIYHGHSGF